MVGGDGLKEVRLGRRGPLRSFGGIRRAHAALLAAYGRLPAPSWYRAPRSASRGRAGVEDRGNVTAVETAGRRGSQQPVRLPRWRRLLCPLCTAPAGGRRGA